MQSFTQLPRWAKLAVLVGAVVGVYVCFALGMFVASKVNPVAVPAAPPTVVAIAPSIATATRLPAAPVRATDTLAPPTLPPSATVPPATATPSPTKTATLTPSATATPSPTRTATGTATAAATVLLGTPSPTVAPERLTGAKRSTDPSAKTGILVKIRNAEGKPVVHTYAAAYQQKADLNNNPIFGDKVAEGRTDDSGVLTLAVPPGTYAMSVPEIPGDSWGDPFNFTVTSGNVSVLDMTLARLRIGVSDADGKGVRGRYTQVRKQKQDLSGNPIKGDEVASSRTDDAGITNYDIFPGIYAVAIGDFAGYPYGDELNHALPAGETTPLIVKLGRLVVGVQNADKKAVPGRYVRVRLQKKDLEGKPIKGDQVVDGRTSDTGLVSWDLTEGPYAVEIWDIQGATWGEELNHDVKGGATTTITVSLGRLTVGLKDPNGKAIGGRYAAVYLPKHDVSGNTIKGDRVAEGRTDDRGLLSFDLTPGEYIVDIQDIGTLRKVPVEASKTTFTDGSTIQ